MIRPLIKMSALCVVATSWLMAAAETLHHADKAAIIEAAAHHLETDYVEAASTGIAAAAQLRRDFAAGDYANLTSGAPFAAALSQRLQSLTGDGHLNIEYSETARAMTDAEESGFDAAQMQRWYGAHVNYGVEAVQRLDGNVGYLDLRVFPPIDMGAETLTAAMTVLADLEALIIDLRRNGGGIGDSADLVASYLFDSERRPLTGTYDRPTDTLTQRFTQAYVPGRRFGPDKPVYVLISAKTFSAAEALAYNLQALSRATIIGEASGGGAHPFAYEPIDEHFVLWSVTAKSVHPLTGTNWQGVGVQPDIAVPSDQALERAISEIRGAATKTPKPERPPNR